MNSSYDARFRLNWRPFQFKLAFENGGGEYYLVWLAHWDVINEEDSQIYALLSSNLSWLFGLVTGKMETFIRVTSRWRRFGIAYSESCVNLFFHKSGRYITRRTGNFKLRHMRNWISSHLNPYEHIELFTKEILGQSSEPSQTTKPTWTALSEVS